MSTPVLLASLLQGQSLDKIAKLLATVPQTSETKQDGVDTSRSLQEKFADPPADPLIDQNQDLLLLPYSITRTSCKAVLRKTLLAPAAERPVFACITLRDAAPVVTVLWGTHQCIKSARHRTTLHSKIFSFHCDVISGKLPLTVKVDVQWLCRETLSIPSNEKMDQAIAAMDPGTTAFNAVDLITAK
eukprot:7160654-Ditylum_brightwellii.AAC.1